MKPMPIFLAVLVISSILSISFSPDFYQPQFIITEEVCEEKEVLIDSIITDSNFERINETFRIKREYTYLGDFEQEVFQIYKYRNLGYDLRSVYIVDFINATIYNYETGELEEYYPLIDADSGRPLELIEDWYFSNNVQTIKDLDYGILGKYGFREITLNYRLHYEKRKDIFETKTVCNQIELGEIEFGKVISKTFLENCGVQFEEYLVLIQGNSADCPLDDSNMFENKIVSKKELTTEWLNENAECVEMNGKITERKYVGNGTWIWYPSCSKYKLNNYTIEVK